MPFAFKWFLNADDVEQSEDRRREETLQISVCSVSAYIKSAAAGGAFVHCAGPISNIWLAPLCLIKRNSGDLWASERVSHLADLIQGVLSVSSSVFEVVVSRECPVDVPGDGAVLRRLLTNERERERGRGKGQGVWGAQRTAWQFIREPVGINPTEAQQWSVFVSEWRTQHTAGTHWVNQL